MENGSALSPLLVASPQPPLVKRPSSTTLSSVSVSGASLPFHRKSSSSFLPPRMRRTLSVHSSERDLRFEVFFHLPNHADLQKLQVHRATSLISLQAMLQREFDVPFEDQRLYFHGELLEGDEELTFYEIHDQSIIHVRIRKRYRSIGDIFTKIKVVQFTSTTTTEDFELVDVVAALPPLRTVLRRLAITIAYIAMLDHMQFKKTNRRVWKPHVSLWDEPGSAVATAVDVASSSSSRSSRKPFRKVPQAKANTSTTLPPPTAQLCPTTRTQAAKKDSDVSSFVMRKCSPERVSYLASLAQTHSIRERLQAPPETRSGTDVRHIRKWLSSIKYFANANIPDPAFHEIAKCCVYARYRSGDYIFRQGDVGEFFYILISGCISLAAYGNGYFATMTPGMCFGEVSLFEAKGIRTASANVSFVTPYAELAVLSGDVYRRAINPYKQAVLHKTEQFVYSVPQLRCLPDHVLTHIAYASKTLTAKTGTRLIRHGDELNVLVLLIAGEVKVATPREKQIQSHDTSSNATAKSPRGSSKLKPTFNQEHSDLQYPVVSVVRAPAVFGQEGSLTNTPKPAPWDIEAMDTCTIVCLRTDTISIFLAPRQDIIRSLVGEHQARVEDFQRRFQQHARLQEEAKARQKLSVAVHKQASSYLRMLSSTRKLFLKDESKDANSCTTGPRQRSPSRTEFPAVLPKDEPHKQRNQQQQRAQTAPTCAELQDRFLHRALPHGNILELREQIQFVSFEQQQRDWQQRCPRRPQKRQDAQNAEEGEERVEARTQTLLHGLRQLKAEDVEMMAPMPSSTVDPSHHLPQSAHYRFASATPPH